MPLLPLPFDQTSVGGGDLPVAEDSDVLAEFPTPIKRVPVAPIRDAFVSAFTAGFLEYQTIAGRAAGESDPQRATGDRLSEYADEHVVVPLPGESESSIQARIFDRQDVAAPDVILDAINALIAPFTAGTATLSELELDGWFVHDSSASTWDSYIGTDADYPDRYYTELPSLLPGGCVPSRGYPRSILIRIPPLEANDSTITYILDNSDDGTFVMDAEDDEAMNLFVDPQIAEDLYLQIIRLVERIKGQGISWSLIVDPALTPS